MRKLCLSFTGTMAALVSGKLQLEDLDQALIVFGCSRGHCLEPGALGERIEPIVRNHPSLHRQLAGAVLLAEHEGRVRWRSTYDGEYEWVRALIAHLADHGYPVVLPQPPDRHPDRMRELTPLLNPEGWPYLEPTYPDVERSVLTAGLDLEVVWRG